MKQADKKTNKWHEVIGCHAWISKDSKIYIGSKLKVTKLIKSPHSLQFMVTGHDRMYIYFTNDGLTESRASKKYCKII